MGEVGITILLASCKQPLSNETIAVQKPHLNKKKKAKAMADPSVTKEHEVTYFFMFTFLPAYSSLHAFKLGLEHLALGIWCRLWSCFLLASRCFNVNI